MNNKINVINQKLRALDQQEAMVDILGNAIVVYQENATEENADAIDARWQMMLRAEDIARNEAEGYASKKVQAFINDYKEVLKRKAAVLDEQGMYADVPDALRQQIVQACDVYLNDPTDEKKAEVERLWELFRKHNMLSKQVGDAVTLITDRLWEAFLSSDYSDLTSNKTLETLNELVTDMFEQDYHMLEELIDDKLQLALDILKGRMDTYFTYQNREEDLIESTFFKYKSQVLLNAYLGYFTSSATYYLFQKILGDDWRLSEEYIEKIVSEYYLEKERKRRTGEHRRQNRKKKALPRAKVVRAKIVRAERNSRRQHRIKNIRYNRKKPKFD